MMKKQTKNQNDRKSFREAHLLVKIKSFSCFVLSLICIFAATGSIAFATENSLSDSKMDEFAENNILFYKPGSGASSCHSASASSSTTLAGDTVPEKIWNFFIQQGFNDVQAAGLVGNAETESSFLPAITNAQGCWGLFQWCNGRRDNVHKKIKDAGLGQYLEAKYGTYEGDKDIPKEDRDRLVQIQLEYAMSEKDFNWQKELKTATESEPNAQKAAEIAAEVFLVLFERATGGTEALKHVPPARPGELYQGTVSRRENAKKALAAYSGSIATSSDFEVAASSSSSISGFESNLTIIGDSITDGSRASLKAKFGQLSDDSISASVGRQFSEGISIAQNLNTSGIVVVALGTNSNSLSKEQLDAMLTNLSSAQKIVLVTNYGVADYTSNNELLRRASLDNANVILADWHAAVKADSGKYLSSDQIHPTKAGQDLFAEVIYSAVNSGFTSDGCSVSGEFSNLILEYAWPDFHAAPYSKQRPAYAAAVDEANKKGLFTGGNNGNDCGGFVSIVVRNSGIEPDYNVAGTVAQEAWVKKKGWTLLNSSDSTQVDTSILQPGDVAYGGYDVPTGHSFIYVGEIPGFNSNVASASYGSGGATSGRSPMAGRESLLMQDGVPVRWYRKTP